MSAPPKIAEGDTRDHLIRQLAREYQSGSTVRELARSHHLSYGLTHRLLGESGVELRARGKRRAS